MSWFMMTCPKTGKVLATSAKRVETQGSFVKDNSGNVIAEVEPQVNVIGTEDIYIAPGFEKKFNNICDNLNNKGDK